MNDITGNCNLRCPFCTNDWGNIDTTEEMSVATFERVLAEAASPSIGKECFFLSCAFEPTIHSRFVELLEMIPQSLRHKTFMSTNLAAPLTDTAVSALGRARLHHINVSVESLVPEVYEAFRRGAKYETFTHNLTRLVAALDDAGDAAPRLHFISMLFRQNADELVTMIPNSASWFGVKRHEIRIPFEFSLEYMTEEFKLASILSDSEVASVVDSCAGLNAVWKISHGDGSAADVRVISTGSGL